MTDNAIGVHTGVEMPGQKPATISLLIWIESWSKVAVISM